MIKLDFDKGNGLIPVIAQQYDTGEVLMLAYMNEESWKLTLSTGIVHYWSRSRSELWKKGVSSGNIQEVKEIRVDCDNDTILIKINQIGEAACHTGYQSCFYTVVEGENTRIDGKMVFNPEDKYGAKK